MALNAVLSDVHGNLQALEAVFEEIDQLGCDQVYALGDLVGYGARSNECLELIKARGVRCLRGNHDREAAAAVGRGDFNEQAWAAIEYTRGVLTEENRVFLKSLPETIRIGADVLMVHGSFDDPDRYIEGPMGAMMTADQLFQIEGAGLCFFGHTHIPMAADQGGVLPFYNGEVAWSPGRRLMLNPGSVGQPRDQSSKASFLIWDDEAMSFDFKRVAYDVTGAQEDILGAGLPEWLAVRLGRRSFSHS